MGMDILPVGMEKPPIGGRWRPAGIDFWFAIARAPTQSLAR